MFCREKESFAVTLVGHRTITFYLSDILINLKRNRSNSILVIDISNAVQNKKNITLGISEKVFL